LKITPKHRRNFCHITLMILAALVSSCASDYTQIYAKNPEQTAILGHAEGSACGTMFLAGTATNVIPAMLNSRTARAYQDAVQSVPGATALTNVTVKENWFWWVVGTTRCVTITGEAY
jgi:hypothetical protein